MKTVNIRPENIDEYIALYPEYIREKLNELRTTIRNAAPQATEKISYGIPTFDLKGNLVHFAAYKNHIGFYPGSSGIEVFKEELSKYKNAKGSVQFPVDKQIPLDLIVRIVKYRVNENLEIAAAKIKRKK